MNTFIETILNELQEKSLSHPNPCFVEAVEEITNIINNQLAIQKTSDNYKLLNEFLADKKLIGCSPGTLKNYRLKLVKFLESVEKPLEEVSCNDIKGYIASFTKSKKNTIATKISILKSFFSYLTTEEIITRNPTIKLKKVKEEKRQPKYLNMIELLKLREACGNDIRSRALLEFMFETGCRVSEIVNINKDDIDWDKRSIKIFGKGSKERIVYFHVNTFYYLNEYLSTREDNCTALFVSKVYPARRLHPRSVQLITKKLGKDAGISKNMHPHVLRHTFSTYLLNKGMDIAIVSELLGHERLSTTQIYAKLTERRKETEYTKYFA